MKNTVIYLLPGRRRPVRLRPELGLHDRQAGAPAGWCGRCGAEVYRWGEALCDRCREIL